ncbi:MAG TPA: glucokinase [Usitatibacter sp.]
MILAGDVGATKILLEVGDSRTGKWEAMLSRRYAAEGAANFSAILEAFFEEWKQSRPNAGYRITAAGFGVAGPVTGNRVKMTNRPWIVDGDAIAARFHIPDVTVVNDLVACAHGIAWVPSRECVTLQPGRAAEHEPSLVMGVGTGLGVAYLVDVDGKPREVAGEGGHAGFAPATLVQAELWHAVFAAHGRCSAEMILSGAGLTNIYTFLQGKGAHASTLQSPLPEKISKSALDGSDRLSDAALDLFVECLGSVAGDHALAAMARGGVYLTGGIVAKILPRLQSPRFREAFCAKAPFSALLMRIPVRAVTSERVGVLGAARLAIEA